MPSIAPSSPPVRSRTRARAWALALVVVLSLPVLAWALGGVWMRPALQRYVLSHSGRRLDCDSVTLSFHGSLDPTIEFRNLVIQNAPWAASKKPFIRAGTAAATISWRSIGSSLLVLDLVVLRDAQVDMERQANGIRNWRLSHPDDAGPPRARVLALDAQRSTLHTVQAGIGLVADAAISPLPPQPALPGHAGLPLTKRLTFDGSYQGHAFAVDAAVSDVLAFGGTPRRFSLRGTAQVGGLRLDAQGISNDAHRLDEVDCDVKLATIGDGPLWPLPAALARVRPLAASAHLSNGGSAWTARAVQASFGRRTSLAGDAHFVGSIKDASQRRILDARLHDVVVDLADLDALQGEPAAPRRAAQAGAGAISAAPLDTAPLREFDADVDLKNARILGSPGDLLQSLRLHATLAAGDLRVGAFDLGAADGHVTGSLQFDASHAPNRLALDLRARGVDIARLSPKLARKNSLSGRVDAQAQLHAQGASPRALVSAAAGTLSASLAPGATVSKRLDAKLSLDGGEWLRSLFDKSDRVPVQCAELTLAVDHGIGTSQRFAFETARTALAGHGVVSLAAESIDATLTPARKTRALLALDKAIHVHGPLRDLEFTLETPPAGATPERCAATPK